MTLMGISLLFLISSFQLVSSLELELNSPRSVDTSSEFEVDISLDSNNQHDVKLFVHNSPDSKVTRDEYLSEVYNPLDEKWQDSWNYIPTAFPRYKDFKLRFKSDYSEEELQICARLRKTGSSQTFLDCNNLLTLSGEKSSEDTSLKQDNPIETSHSINLKHPLLNISSENEPIILSNKNSGAKKEEIQEIFLTKKEKTLLYVFYSFTVFTIIVLSLIVKRKI